MVWVISPSIVFAASADQVPHLRSLLSNIIPYMSNAVSVAKAGGCGTNGTQITLSDSLAGGSVTTYFSSIYIRDSIDAYHCGIKFTFKSANAITSSYNGLHTIPVPNIVSEKIIYLHTNGLGWDCQTDIDSAYYAFKGAQVIQDDMPSIISYYPENVYVANCVYVPNLASSIPDPS